MATEELPPTPPSIAAAQSAAASPPNSAVDTSDFDLGDVIDSIRSLLADPEAGRRLDSILHLFHQKAESRAQLTKVIAEQNRQVYQRDQWMRGVLSVFSLCIISFLGYEKIVSGEAVVGFAGAFLGYLWGGREPRNTQALGKAP